MDNNFFTHEDIRSISVQKRKITIMRKRLQKEEKKLNNLEKKYLLRLNLIYLIKKMR